MQVLQKQLEMVQKPMQLVLQLKEPRMQIIWLVLKLLLIKPMTLVVLDNKLLTTGRSWFMNDRRYTVVLRASF